MSFKYPFLTIVHDLNPLINNLVLVGGWVPTVYFEYLWRSPRDFFKTTDVDLALDSSALKNHSLIEEEIDLLSTKKPYKRKHLKLGKEKPYQLIFDSDTPIDFLSDPTGAKKIRDKILGKGILVNESPEYNYLLESAFQVNCEGVMVRVPQPIRYITHKIFVYLENQSERKKDLATAYYCLTRSPEPDALLAELGLLKATRVMKTIKKVASKTASAVRDIQKSLAMLGIHEDEDEILGIIQQLT